MTLTAGGIRAGAVAGRTGSVPLQLSTTFAIDVGVAAELVSALGIPGAVALLAIAGATGITNDIGKLMEITGNKGGSDPYNISDESKEKWGKGTFDSTEDSLKYHFKEHGEEVGAKDIDQYVRKAEGFSQNLKGSSKSYPDNGTPGATRYTKNGKYIIIGPDGKILSYGLAR